MGYLNITQYSDFSSALTAATNKTLYISAPITLPSGDITIPSNVSIEFNRSGYINKGSATSLTIYGDIVGNPMHQIFSGFAPGEIIFGTCREIWADWFGDHTALAVQIAFAAVVSGSNIKMGGGTWAFGTTTVDLTKAGVNFNVNLIGVGYDNTGAKGTEITYSGTSYALIVNGLTTLEKFRVSCGTVGWYGVRFGGNVSPKPWIGAARDLYITGATNGGIYATAIQLGYMENVHAAINTGAGMKIDTADNTLGLFVRCSFKENLNEGIYYNGIAEFRYLGCDIESNYFEGVRGTVTGAVDNTWDGCHFENNYTSQTSGFYQVNLAHDDHARMNFVRNEFRLNKTTNQNRDIKFSGQLIMTDNNYDHTGPFVDFAGVNAVLVDKDINLGINNVTFSHVNNYYYNGTGLVQVKNYSSNSDSGRFSGVVITNAGALGTITINLGPVEAGLLITVIVTVAFQLNINPDTVDQIKPTTDAAGDSISNSGVIGSTITLMGINDNAWIVVASTGTWTDIN